MSKIIKISLLLSVFVVLGCEKSTHQPVLQERDFEPVVAGYGEGRFEIGELIYSNDFSSMEDWVVQLQQADGYKEPKIAIKDNILEAFVPGRGCTIWNTNKFEGRIAIIYKIYCPKPETEIDGIEVRDINNFWHASGSEQNPNLFDDNVYHGGFGSYHQINCYYASTGGGGGIGLGNQTTRFRRYPRMVEGAHVDHIALNHRDGKPEYLITPGKWHTIQLVAYDDVIQYIMDGKVFYEIKYGDEVEIETRENGEIATYTAIYNEEDFPYYSEGYFGFRMVRTHHLHSDFKVFELIPAGE